MGIEFPQRKKVLLSEEWRCAGLLDIEIASRIHGFQQLFDMISKLKLGGRNGQRAGYSHSTVINLTGRILLWKCLRGFWWYLFTPSQLKNQCGKRVETFEIKLLGSSGDNRKPSVILKF